MEGSAVPNKWGAALFAALEGKIPKDYVGQIVDHLPIGLFGLYPRLELEKLTTMLKEREDTIHHLECKCDLLMARVRELRDLLRLFEATPGGKIEDWDE